VLPVIVFFAATPVLDTPSWLKGGGAVVQQQVRLDTPAEIAGILRRLPSAFPEALTELMRWRSVSSEALAKKALYSKSTINRLRSEIDYVSSLDTIVAICIGLRLPPALYMLLIQRAGYSFNGSTRHGVIQQLLLHVYVFEMDIYEFNEALTAYGVTPLKRGE
jgi:DNA-binding Xre family transcriptional regulator